MNGFLKYWYKVVLERGLLLWILKKAKGSSF